MPRWPKTTIEERFWSKVDASGGPDACWPWQAHTNADGYGQFNVNGRMELSHRVVLYLANGTWPNVARHECDYPPCCNLAHVIDGTQGENLRDMVARGRATTLFPKGESHPHRKLTAEGAQEIRRLYVAGEANYPELAAMFAVSQGAIWAVITRRSWTHV